MRRAWTRYIPVRLKRIARHVRSTVFSVRELRARDAELRRLRQRLNSRVRKGGQLAPEEQFLILDWPRGEIRMTVPSGKRVKAFEKEPFTVEWIERHLGPSEVLYDIGANAGAYSLIAATVQPSAHVVAFEPSYSTFALLCDNIRLNGLSDRVMPLPVPLGAATGVGRFRYSSTLPGAASHNQQGAVAFEQRVLAYSLDELVERFGIPRPHHVKLDVDGDEIDVLTGAAELLASGSLRTLMVELAPGDRRVEAYLAERGFRLAEQHEKPVVGSVAYGLFSRPG